MYQLVSKHCHCVGWLVKYFFTIFAIQPITNRKDLKINREKCRN